MTAARLTIRPSTYRDREGFNISGRDAHGHRIRIFCLTRQVAEAIRDLLKQSRDTFDEVGEMLRSEG